MEDLDENRDIDVFLASRYLYQKIQVGSKKHREPIYSEEPHIIHWVMTMLSHQKHSRSILQRLLWSQESFHNLLLTHILHVSLMLPISLAVMMDSHSYARIQDTTWIHLLSHLSLKKAWLFLWMISRMLSIHSIQSHSQWMEGDLWLSSWRSNIPTYPSRCASFIWRPSYEDILHWDQRQNSGKHSLYSSHALG